MNKKVVIIVLLACSLTALLYSLPKTHQNNKKPVKTGAANRDMVGSNTTTPSPSTTTATHNRQFSAEQQKKVSLLKKTIAGTTGAQQIAAYNNLAKYWTEIEFFDSAAVVFEKANSVEPSEKHLLAAANSYFEAYNFALDTKRAEIFGQKARNLYEQLLKQNPALIQAKTNMAMTYVNSSTPMQGILLLREVIADNPDYEPALFNMGMLSLKSNQFSKAAERFKHILANNPANDQARFYLGYSYARQGKNEDAKQQLEKLKQTVKDPAVLAEVNTILNELK
jgi:tetratricopeptide (TPR) repeat protein